jgi:hypothetical protein
MRNVLLAAGVLAALASSGCAMIYDVEGPHWRDYKPPKALAPAIAAPGSEWSYVRHDSGSYGNGVSHVSGKSLPMQTWQGRPHYAYESPEATTLIDPTTGRWAAQLKDGKPVASWDPAIGYHWPMWVGETWSVPYRVTNHATNKTAEFRAWFTVEAQETVHVPAGSFKAFRVVYSAPTLWGVAWWSPDLGIWVKSRFERISGDPAGAGVRQSDLLRADIKPVR